MAVKESIVNGVKLELERIKGAFDFREKLYHDLLETVQTVCIQQRVDAPKTFDHSFELELNGGTLGVMITRSAVVATVVRTKGASTKDQHAVSSESDNSNAKLEMFILRHLVRMLSNNLCGRPLDSHDTKRISRGSDDSSIPS